MHTPRLVIALAAFACTFGSPPPLKAARLPDDDYRTLPCRPTIACTADLVPPGSIEFEVGYLMRRLGTGALQHSTPLLLKLTLAEWVQLQVGTNGGIFAPADEVPASYLDDLVVGLKLHLLDQAPEVPSVSFSAEASIPTFSGQHGYLRTYDALLTVYITKDFGWLHADLNAGFNLWRLENRPLPQGFVALALSADLPRRFGVMVEGYGFTDAHPVSPEDAGVLFAATYAPRPWMMIDLGGDAGLVQATRGFSVFAGFTMIVADLWESRRERLRRRASPP